jgi:hypothetical protein
MYGFRKKPWWIGILKLTIVVNAFFTTLQLLYVFKRSSIELETFWHQLPLLVKLILLFYPIAFLGIRRASAWGWYAILMLLALSSYHNLSLIAANDDNFLFLGIPALIVQIFVFVILLQPSVQQVFQNARLHWWKSASRYLVMAPVEIQTRKREKFSGTTFNISKTGFYLACSPLAMKAGETVSVVIQFPTRAICCQAKVTRVTTDSSYYPDGYALKFSGLALADKVWLYRRLKYEAVIYPQAKGYQTLPLRFNH